MSTNGSNSLFLSLDEEAMLLQSFSMYSQLIDYNQNNRLNLLKNTSSFESDIKFCMNIIENTTRQKLVNFLKELYEIARADFKKIEIFHQNLQTSINKINNIASAQMAVSISFRFFSPIFIPDISYYKNSLLGTKGNLDTSSDDLKNYLKETHYYDPILYIDPKKINGDNARAVAFNNMLQQNQEHHRVDSIVNDYIDKYGILNRKARDLTMQEILTPNTKEGYFQGFKYISIDNTIGSNDVLIGEDNGTYYKAYRFIDKGIIKVKKVEISSEAEYLEMKAAHGNDPYCGIQTYCNFSASKFCLAFGAPQLNYFNNTEYNANNIFDNLKNGKYNNKEYQFLNVNWSLAERYAARGGLAIVSLKSTGHGHIAILSGGYLSNEKKEKNINIFQAGIKDNMGDMNLIKGFGENNINSVQYYIWVKK